MDILKLIEEAVELIQVDMDALLQHGAKANPATIKSNLNTITNHIIDYRSLDEEEEYEEAE